MKKFNLLIAAFMFLTAAVNAQYYYVPYQNAGTNPGGLNSDSEFPAGTGGLDPSWTVILDSSLTPVWSPLVTLPFSFNFNGAPVTQCKVSNSGVLTFNTSAVTVPGFVTAALPNVNIPDNSVCILGIRGTQASDNVVTKTFGVAPNRQFWCMFSSFSTSNASVWTYWSIVLEESSNNIYIVDQRHNFNVSVSAGIQLNPTTAFSVVGSPALHPLAGTDPTSIDNTYYQFIYGTQVAIQTKLSSITVDKYLIVPGQVFIEGSVLNLGANPIASMDVKYESNGTVYTHSLTSLNILSNTSYSFIHSTPLSIPVAAAYPVKIWVDVIGDADHSDDTLNTVVTGLSFQTTKRVLIEEATGTWCGWCPRGAVYTEQIDTVHLGSAIVVAVHNADPMADAVYDGGMNDPNLIGGYPSGLVDRVDLDVDPTAFAASYMNRINDVSPADVGVSAYFNSVSRQVDVVVSATFAAELAGNYRLNAVLVEDNVIGTNSTYSQSNYYSFASNNQPLVGAGHNWQTEPNPVPFSSMVYNFVGRNIMGGFEGQTGSVPSTVFSGTTYSYTFSTTIPITWNASNMRVIGMLQDADLSSVLNVNRGAYGITTTVKELVADAFSMSVYPNPASQSTQLEVNLKNSSKYVIEMFDMLGKSVYSQQFNGSTGKNVFNIPLNGLNAGMYMVKVNVNGSVLTSRLIVK
ncbi:MAG: Omp28-related outer membrane protein [Bacteroidetes bacterium]|nr:Omp28-related outer membrane protein [Bacteroidota bacterium]